MVKHQQRRRQTMAMTLTMTTTGMGNTNSNSSEDAIEMRRPGRSRRGQRRHSSSSTPSDSASASRILAAARCTRWLVGTTLLLLVSVASSSPSSPVSDLSKKMKFLAEMMAKEAGDDGKKNGKNDLMMLDVTKHVSDSKNGDLRERLLRSATRVDSTSKRKEKQQQEQQGRDLAYNYNGGYNNNNYQQNANNYQQQQNNYNNNNGQQQQQQNSNYYGNNNNNNYDNNGYNNYNQNNNNNNGGGYNNNQQNGNYYQQQNNYNNNNYQQQQQQQQNGNYYGNNNYYNNGNNNYYNNGNNYNYNNGNYYNNGNNYNANNYYDNDDGNAAAADDDDSYSSSSSNLDLSNYALKYVGCQNIHQWSDDAAEQADNNNNNQNQNNNYNFQSPLSMTRFVVFRLCESKSCSLYNKWGCNSNYGEYILPIEDYLQITYQYHMTQLDAFCTTCQQCVQASEAFKQARDESSSSSSGGGGDDDGYDDDAAAADDDGNYNANYGNNDDWAGYNQYWGDGNYGGNRRTSQNYDFNDDGFNYNYNVNNYNYYRYYDGYNYNNQQDQQQDDDEEGDDNVSYLDEYGNCIYETVCENYQAACDDYPFSDRNGLEDYFACSQFNIGNSVGYVGPHCSSDGSSIGIGIYADENCANYIGDVVDLSQYFSVADTETELQIYSDKSCIPCKASESFSLVSDSDIESGSSAIYPLCSYLYDESAKCQIHFSDPESSYQSEQQLANEEAVCEFIAAVVENNYDEFGEVVIQEDFDYHNWKSGAEYVKLVRKANAFQIVFLTFSILLCVGLFGYSCYLQKKLHYRRPWVPPTHVGSYFSGPGAKADISDAVSEAGRLSRLNSGITAMRSMVSVDGEASQTGGKIDEHSLTPSQKPYMYL